MKKHHAFTMLELVFVIIVMGIIGKFGVEFIAQAYKNFIYSKVNNTLQADSEYAVEFIAKRLQNRIKDSTIKKKSDGTFKSISDPYFLLNPNHDVKDYNILEWIGVDREGFRGNSDNTTAPVFNKPNWSGIIDVTDGNSTSLVSPATSNNEINKLIKILSYGNSDINDSAIYFIGSGGNVKDSFGWREKITDKNITDQNQAIHPIKSGSSDNEFVSALSTDTTFSDVYEQYQFSWSAYAIVLEDYNSTSKTGNLMLYYNFQPWQGEDYNNTGKNIQQAIIMQNVSSFRTTAIDSVIKVQVCVKSSLIEEYSICKEKTVL